MNELIFFIIAIYGFLVYAVFMITKFLLHTKVTKLIAGIHIVVALIAFFSFLPLFINNIEMSLWAIIGFILLILGFFIIYKASTSLKEQLIIPKGKLITLGIFSKVRNPTYLGIILLAFGSFFFSLSIYVLVYAVLITLLFILIIKAEERNLIRMFGKEYIYYKKKVPALIPRI